jgi:tellurite methyltransferase
LITTAEIDWSEFHRKSHTRPPRELLIRTLNFFDVESRSDLVAVDLGCGSGADTLELLRRGWKVHCVDADPEGLEMLKSKVPPEFMGKVRTYTERIESFPFPECDLVWASYAFPFCPAANWEAMVRKATSALRPKGRIAGDVFGDKHAWAGEADVLTLSETNLRIALSALDVEAFDIENGYRVSGSEITRWHSFGFSACKPLSAQ